MARHDLFQEEVIPVYDAIRQTASTTRGGRISNRGDRKCRFQRYRTSPSSRVIISTSLHSLMEETVLVFYTVNYINYILAGTT